MRDVEFPGVGTASGFERQAQGPRDLLCLHVVHDAGDVYRYDVASGESTVWRQPKLQFDPDDYETTQVFYKSKDGTRIPMFLSHKKGLKRDGRLRPCSTDTADSTSR